MQPIGCLLTGGVAWLVLELSRATVLIKVASKIVSLIDTNFANSSSSRDFNKRYRSPVFFAPRDKGTSTNHSTVLKMLPGGSMKASICISSSEFGERSGYNFWDHRESIHLTDQEALTLPFQSGYKISLVTVVMLMLLNIHIAISLHLQSPFCRS